MPTAVTKTIKAAGGDYGSLAAWEAVENSGLVGADERRRALCYDLGALDGPVTIAGGTVDATRYLLIEAADNHNGAWNTGVYRIGVSDHTNVIVNVQSYTRFSGIQIETNGLGGFAGMGISMTDGGAGYPVGCYIERCLIRNVYLSDAVSAPSYGIRIVSLFTNFIGYNVITARTNTNSYGIYTDFSASAIYSNTVRGTQFGIIAVDTAVLAKNNVVQACGTCYSGLFDAASSNNVADDGTQPGSNGISAGVAFVSTTPGSEDLHLADNDRVAKGRGVNLTADVTYPITVDIDNIARVGTWDAGADQSPAHSGFFQRRAAFGLVGMM